MKATAIFDIGKTNKKFFLFDASYNILHKAYTSFEELQDEDGFPCDDLAAIESWIFESFHSIFHGERFKVKALNFSTYGASLVHLDKKGKPLTPLYNYLKPVSEDLLDEFYHKYGDTLPIETASPRLGMLNSGFQLFWLKHTHPEIFAKTRYSLHLPQYLSFLFTGIPLSEYTSIGCHTTLWDYSKKDYHDWVYAEGIDRVLPPIVNTDTSIKQSYAGKKLEVGVGIHDSSAALIPYRLTNDKPFLLVSTGTWSISLNPFNPALLTEEDLGEDCLNFLSTEGQAVKASRLFLGNEYKLQVNKLNQHFDKESSYHEHVKFNAEIYTTRKQNFTPQFCFESINLSRNQPQTTILSAFANFEEAYHQLIMELVELQIKSCERAIGKTTISKLYIDGGFVDNDIYLKLLTAHFRDCKIRPTLSPIGSALGAALLIYKRKINKRRIKQIAFDTKREL